MVKHIFAIKAEKPKSKSVKILGYLTALVIVLLAIHQMLLLIGLVAGKINVVGETTLATTWFFASTWLGFVIFLGILSVPFLIGMKASPLMRLMSMVLGWIVAVNFLISLLIVDFVSWEVRVTGLYTVDMKSTWQLLLLAILLVIAVGLMTWGRWPKRELNWKLMRKEQQKLYKQQFKKLKKK